MPADYTAEAIDLPGYGEAPPGDLDACADLWPADAHWVCWSMSGLIALSAIARGVRCRSLALIGCAPRMVGCENFPHAIAPAAFSAFRARMRANAEDGMHHFAGLVAAGDAQCRRVHATLLEQLRVPEPATLTAGLDLLEHTDVRDVWCAHDIPQLQLFGDTDSLIPHTTIAATHRLCPEQPQQIFTGAGHAPMISQPEAVATALAAFWESC